MTDGTFGTKKRVVSGDRFIGREKELATLSQAADAADIRHLSVYGLPHVGKTSLLTQWLYRLKARGYKSDSGRVFICLSETVNGFSCQRALMKRLLKSLAWQIREAVADGRLPDEDVIRALRKSLRTYADHKDIDVAGLKETLSAAIRQIGEYGVRTVLILDEFETVTQDWSEEEYLSFVRLLMEERLELVCFVCSRPHISYIASRFVRQLAPFEPCLLQSFSDEDMFAFLERFRDAGGEDLTKEAHKVKLNRLLYYCGRNPYLLRILADAMLAEDLHDPDEAHARYKEAFWQQYHDVVRFMLTEEEKSSRSFSHIIKCYFGTSEDYEDILESYIPLGYIEREDLTGPFAAAYARFCYTDRESGKEWGYVTLCPAFIDYLYAHTLDEIRDVRDLLTGLLHTLRYITEKELADLYPAPARWDEELLLRMRGHYQNDSSRAVYTDENNIVYPVKFSWGNWIWCKLPELRSGVILNHMNSPDEPWIRDRREWIEDHEDQMIDMAATSMIFAINAYNSANSAKELTILDAISLADHAAILRRYRNRFVKYFGVVGNISEEGNFEILVELLKRLQEDVRNPISHYSRRKCDRQTVWERKALCIYLLKNIYSYLEDGVVAEPREFEAGTEADAEAAHEARKGYRRDG